MGLFGGGSKSSSSIDQSQTTYETNDQSFIQAGQAGVRGDNNVTNVNTLDGGAITAAFSFANARGEDETARYALMIDAQKSTAQAANDLAKRALDVTNSAASTAQSNIVNAYAQANDKPVPLNFNLIIGAISVIALLMMVK